MSKINELFYKALESKRDNAERVIGLATTQSAWSYGFYDGWNEALKAKFDDRAALARWRESSKHSSCTCSTESRCTTSCPHGEKYMSGVCIYCISKYNEIEIELEAGNG